MTTAARIRAAERYARSREGTIAFAALGDDGRLLGVNRTERFPSASVIKAMLMVAVLRSGPLTPQRRALLGPMITRSDNKAAEAVFDLVGASGLCRVAQAAHMRDFYVNTAVFEAQLTAADQARLFARIDTLVPAAHRAYARSLLASIVPEQRWGIAPVASTRGYRIFFKGGWRKGLVHQVALLERAGRRLALAILTTGEPSTAYGEATLAGIAARVLEP